MRDQCISDRVPARIFNLETRLGRYICIRMTVFFLFSVFPIFFHIFFHRGIMSYNWLPASATFMCNMHMHDHYNNLSGMLQIN